MTEIEAVAESHYENFPVASFFLHGKVRRAVRLIYAFARTADDFADEGNEEPEVRIQKLNYWENNLIEAVSKGDSSSSFFRSLAEVIRSYNLPLSLFSDLITAFRMDARSERYDSFDDLLIYCRHSANPVGRIMLQLFSAGGEENCRFSDHVCTALQLINFWQDLSVDTKRSRFYIPCGDAKNFGITGDHYDPAYERQWINLVRFETERTISLFMEGKPLFNCVPDSYKTELRLIWHGGMRIAEKIKEINFRTFAERPALTLIDKLIILQRALFSR